MGGDRALSRRLWVANADLAHACLDHPFVRGLGDGTLAREAFRGYVAQDVFFLRAFLAAYALAGARSVDRPEHFRILHQMQRGGLDELELHARYAERLEIDLVRVRPLPATSAYADFLLRTAWSAESGEIVAAMTPCMRLYAWLGRELAPHSPAGNPYQDWIDTYGSDGFASLAAALESLLDDAARDEPPIRDAYRYAMRCELAFFEEAGSARPPDANE